MCSLWGNKETLGEIAVTIAHEIKNPLAVALANIDLIKETDTAEVYEKYCGIIEQELYKINQLVFDLINITLLSNESDEMFDLTEMLDQLTSEYQLRYETISFLRQQDLPAYQFRGVVKHIRMVFTNILNNAVEAITQQGIIEIIQENRPNAIQITINDNGVGLPPETLIQPDKFYTTKKNGTGIGLHYCRLAIAKYGGRFKLQNRPEGGCSAIIELPRKDI